MPEMCPNQVSFLVIGSLSLTVLLLLIAFIKSKKIIHRQDIKIKEIENVALVRGMFVSVASHEFRNPMTTIYSSIDLLEYYSENLSPQETIDIFTNVRKSIKKISSMMDSMLVIGKVQRHQIFLTPKEMCIFHYCRQLIEELDPEFSRVILYGVFNLPLRVSSIDPTIFRHIFVNLLSNALKYSKDKVTVRISVFEKQLCFEVQDDGIGIPEDEIGQLTQLFARCSNTNNVQGIGIGMFLVGHCVKLHQGKIFVKSTPNCGTVFKILLPLF